MKKKYILLTEKRWHDPLFAKVKSLQDTRWYRINNRKDFSIKNISSIRPDVIFIPHWSYMIPADIYDHYPCVIFHMTDLPYGRGGSPLQNLIVRGCKETVISAIKAGEEVDAGDVYLKKRLSLKGTAAEIFLRASSVIEKMIIEIILKNTHPIPQNGKVVKFKRRKPKEGNMRNVSDINKIYDYIRMLDAEGYPPAYIETRHFKINFTNASLNPNKTITAHVRIIKK